MKIYNEYMGEDKGIFVKCFIKENQAPNVIFLMTPIASIEHKLAIENYRPLFDNGFNVFAIDLPGSGNSSKGKFTYENIKAAIKTIVKYIQKNYSDSIHLYGGTGTGGIIGQALASDKELSFLKSYSQFGVANHNDLSVIGNSFFLRIIYPILKILVKFFPEYRLKFKIPKYKGYNAEKENEWYRSMMKEYPGIFDLPLEVVYTLLWLMIAKNSPIKGKPFPPTLVLAAKYDRYYKKEYIKNYYHNLGTNKKIHWVDDSHCVFVWGTLELTNQVTEWINFSER